MPPSGGQTVTVTSVRSVNHNNNHQRQLDDKLITQQDDTQKIRSGNSKATESEASVEYAGWEPTILWWNVVAFGLLHLLTLYGLYLAIFEAKWQTILFCEYPSVVLTVIS